MAGGGGHACLMAGGDTCAGINSSAEWPSCAPPGCSPGWLLPPGCSPGWLLPPGCSPGCLLPPAVDWKLSVRLTACDVSAPLLLGPAVPPSFACCCGCAAGWARCCSLVSRLLAGPPAGFSPKLWMLFLAPAPPCGALASAVSDQRWACFCQKPRSWAVHRAALHTRPTEPCSAVSVAPAAHRPHQ
jgi:hypothetical protein